MGSISPHAASPNTSDEGKISPTQMGLLFHASSSSSSGCWSGASWQPGVVRADGQRLFPGLRGVFFCPPSTTEHWGSTRESLSMNKSSLAATSCLPHPEICSFYKLWETHFVAAWSLGQTPGPPSGFWEGASEVDFLQFCRGCTIIDPANDPLQKYIDPFGVADH